MKIQTAFLAITRVFGQGAGKGDTPLMTLPLNMQANGIGWYLPRGAKMDGNIKLSCGALIEGDFIGTLECSVGSIIMRQGANFTGRMVASKVYIGGTVISRPGERSQIIGHLSVGIAAAGRVDADIKSNLISLVNPENVFGKKERLA